MTIDKTITHQRELAEEFRSYKTTNEKSAFKKQCEKQAKECEQIAEWLEELKARRESNFDYVKLMDSRYKEGYSKGLSVAWDLAFKLLNEDQEILVKLFGTDEVDEIISRNTPQEAMARYGEQLKAGEENE